MLADTLPSDIWIVVLYHLSVEDLAHLAQTSRYFHALVRPTIIPKHLDTNETHRRLANMAGPRTVRRIPAILGAYPDHCAIGVPTTKFGEFAFYGGLSR